MNFHLNHLGKTEYPVSLESLKLRREARELNGTELVWTDGMTEWQALDTVFANQHVALDPRVYKKRRSWLQWVIAAMILAAVGMGVMGFWVFRILRQVRTMTAQVIQSRQFPGRDSPIPNQTNSLTQTDINKRARAFRVREYLESYEQHSRRDDPTRSPGSQFLTNWLASVYDKSAGADLDGLRRTAADLINTRHCQDPVILTIASTISLDAHEKTALLERALKEFRNTTYPSYPRLFATVVLARQSEDQEWVRELHTSALELFKTAFTDGSLRPEEEPEIAHLLVEDWGAEFFKEHGEEIAGRIPASADWLWLREVLTGAKEINASWKARGGGYSDTVTTQGWKDFTMHLSKARAALDKAWKMHPDRPLAAAEMITVAMGENGGYEMRTWFDEAVKAQIDHPLAWSNYRWGLRPRWHGSHEKLLALGISAIDTGRFDTDVPRKFFDCVSDIESEMKLPRGQHIYGREDIWTQLKRMYEGYCEKTPEGDERDGWRSTYSVVAFLASHPEVAREQLEKLQWKPHPLNLTGWNVDLSLMPLQVAAITGPLAEDAKKAENSYQHHQLDRARARYVALSQSPQADERLRELAKRRLASMSEEVHLDKGEWVDFLPAATNDPNWVVISGKIIKVEPGAVEIESGAEGHMLYSRTRMGAAFEVEGEFDVVSTSTQDFQAGVVMGIPDNFNSSWDGFRIKSNAVEGQVVTFSRHFGEKEIMTKASVAPGHNSFRFATQAGNISAWLNGEQVSLATTNKSSTLHTNSVLGLGAYNDANDTVIRYRHVRARRIPQP